MPETVDQPLPTPVKEFSPVSRVIARIKEALHRHTPEGRREEYREKWNQVLEGTKGLPRFELERRIGQEADKYARDRVTRDVFVVAAATAAAGLGIGGIVAWKNQARMKELFSQFGANVKSWTEQTIANAAAKATKLGLEGAARTIRNQPNLVAGIAGDATTQAAIGLQEAVASAEVQNRLKLVGLDAATATIDGAKTAVETQIKTAPDQARARILNFFSNLLSRATEKMTCFL